MKVKDIITGNPEVISPESALVDAARKMKKSDIGALPVCDGEKLVGMITDRDITVRGTAEGRDPNKTKVRDVMSKEIICALEDEELDDAAELMENLQIRRLPILDSDRRLIGIISVGDVATRAGNEGISAELLECVSNSEPVGKQKAIARRAFNLYLEHGAEPGRDLDHWLQAEKELQHRNRRAIHPS